MNFITFNGGNNLVVGHGAWIGLSLHWGIMGLMIGGIIALMTAPKGFYE